MKILSFIFIIFFIPQITAAEFAESQHIENYYINVDNEYNYNYNVMR